MHCGTIGYRKHPNLQNTKIRYRYYFRSIRVLLDIEPFLAIAIQMGYHPEKTIILRVLA
jgi:hypothetical protein